MIPIRHMLSLRSKPIVTRALVLANTLLFILMLFLGERTEMLINNQNRVCDYLAGMPVVRAIFVLVEIALVKAQLI